MCAIVAHIISVRFQQQNRVAVIRFPQFCKTQFSFTNGERKFT